MWTEQKVCDYAKQLVAASGGKMSDAEARAMVLVIAAIARDAVNL